ncbi:MAG TPA: hypothetical protein ENJ86_14055 [Methylothermaceae bacterium]|nr:hypothetical protein [Methylothermaceae bacterium]
MKKNQRFGGGSFRKQSIKAGFLSRLSKTFMPLQESNAGEEEKSGSIKPHCQAIKSCGISLRQALAEQLGK